MSGAAGPDGHGHEDENGHGMATDAHAHEHGTATDAHGHAHVHVVPIPIYLAVFAALMLGTYLTVWAAGRDFGAFNTVVALGIAVTKATLVILFFMHVKYSPRLTQLVVATAFVFLALLVLGTLTDYYSPNADGKLQPAHLQRQ